MTTKKVNLIPDGIRVIRDDPKDTHIQYKALNRTVFFWANIAYVLLGFSVLGYFLFNLSLLQAMIIFGAIGILFHVVSYTWIDIVIKPDTVVIDVESYENEHLRLRVKPSEDAMDEILLDYGAETRTLSWIRKNAFDCVNYINDAINKIKNNKASQSPSNYGEREQVFEAD